MLTIAMLPMALLATALLAPDVLAWQTVPSAGEDNKPPVLEGEVEFKPTEQEADIAARFRLEKHRFPFQQRPWRRIEGQVEITRVTFPSPVKTPHELNNTVHCEFFRPLGEHEKAKTPGVVVLHILGGDFDLARLFCMAMARRGSAALFLKMPYYGPRRTKGDRRRMISEAPAETVEGMTQAVLDIRRAVAWLGSRKGIDDKQLGVFGISLGGITGALAATCEPRLNNVCLLLAGGDVARVAWESPETKRVRRKWLESGGTREQFYELLAAVDPVRYAKNVRGRRILMLNAKQDEIIPRACTDSLWKAFGKPPIVWYSGGHYSVARHFFDAIRRVGDFFDAKQ